MLLEKIHDIRAIVHVVAALEALEDAGVQVLVHVAMLEGVVRGFNQRGSGGGEVGEEGGEAHADFEGVGHGD